MYIKFQIDIQIYTLMSQSEYEGTVTVYCGNSQLQALPL